MDHQSKPYTNGSPKGPKGMNGVNGVDGINGINGTHGMNGTNGMKPANTANGHAVVSRRNSPVQKKRRGFFARSFNIAARLLTWYSIFTLLFRCPSTLDACTDKSPAICKPYFQVKQSVLPHVTPYYHTYAEPYVDRARPYYAAVDRAVVTPGRTFAVKYGGPRVAQAQAFGQGQWEKNVQPQIAKYQSLAKGQYDQRVSPHVEKASDVVSPYYDIARTNALQTYHEFMLPAYLFVQPYAARGYDAAYAFTAKTAVPSTVWAWNKTYAFLDSAVWPHLRDVYVMKVEPQLVRIGERLGRYNEKKSKPAPDQANFTAPASTFIKPSSSISSSTAYAAEGTPDLSSTAVDSLEAPESSAASDDPAKVPKDREEARKLAAKTVAEDLELWEGKFSEAADEGAVEIEERVHEIAYRMIERHAKPMGKSLVTQLDDTVTSEIEHLKKALVGTLEKNAGNAEKGDEEIVAAIRSAGLAIKNKAQDVRNWRQSYEQETEIAVTKAAQEHFTLLANTRDLALQKIGIKWAWMDGVTYKDWQKYHQLKARFDEWTQDLKRLITTHPGLLESQAAATEIEDEAMGIAQAAAEELARLKQVAAWKAAAGDLTDDFDSDTMRLAAEAAQEKVADDMSESTETSTVVDGEQTETVTVSLAGADSDGADTSALAPLESLTTEPTESASDLPSASDLSETRSSQDKATRAAESVESLPISEPADGPEQLDETIVESPGVPTQSAEDAASTTIKSALFGAAAQSVPSRQPILDDDFVSSASSAASVVQSDVPASITSAAQSAYTAAIAGAADQYSRAMSAVSAQVKGEPKPVHEEMLSSVSNAYFGAMASANSRLGEAMTAASAGIYGTPTTKWMPDMPTMPSMPSVDWEKAQSIAQQNLQDSVSWASEQYEAAKVALGAAEPTPSTYLEGAEKMASKLLDQAQHNYYAGVGMAHARYAEFLSAASTAVSSLTATPTPTNLQESAASAASVASQSASSVASVAGESASGAVSAASEAAGSVAASVGDMASGARDSVGENWDAIVSRVSSQVYGAPTPTPWYENLYTAAGDYASVAGDYASAAGDYAASATDAAADHMSSMTAFAGGYGASAGDAASSQYAAVSSLVSELVMGKEPTFTESVYSRLAGAYVTGASSASSLASAASATVASAASEITDSAGSVVNAAGDTVSAVTDRVKETIDHMRDEL
ncbi:Uu.00g061980.m01.CDS01 [Anthostomella pinea]|uniref:Uu.00g061980.m01.CDS01 n=1 Tax=Anthostomella pinea TaxID=933095 RepID=A0AAI8VSM0_9PEZI|nr:Uu.00g061980.m01.CDS01 [Anthostomella pinea]